MTSLVSVRRRWTFGAIAGGLVGLMALGALAYVGADTLRNSKEGRPANELPPARELPPTHAALLAVRDEQGALTSLAVLALSPPDDEGVSRGGTVIPIPVGTGVLVGEGFLRERLAEIYVEQGLEEMVADTGAELTLSFSVVAEVDEPALADLLAPLGPVGVDIPGDVIDTPVSEDSGSDETGSDDSGSDDSGSAGAASDDAGSESDDEGAEIVVPSGAGVIDPDRGAALLAAWDAAQPEAAQFEQEIAFWNGAQDRVGAGLEVAAPAGTPTDSMRNFLLSMFRGPIRVYGLRGIPITTGIENPNATDMYHLVNAEVIRVMATVLPNAVSPINDAFRVQIIDPFGDPAITEAAITRLNLPGVGIVLVRELSGIEVPEVTQISLGGRVDIAEIQPYADSLGQTAVVPLGVAGTPHGRVQDVDATFVLGQSFVDLVARQSTTSVPTSTTDAATVSGANETTNSTQTTATTEAGG